MLHYKKVWQGAEYNVYLKYSNALNLIFVAMWYGVGMPILFPLTALAIFSQWACERLLIAREM